MSFCHNCNRHMHFRAMPNHIKAHHRRSEACTVTYKSGTYEFSPEGEPDE